MTAHSKALQEAYLKWQSFNPNACHCPYHVEAKAIHDGWVVDPAPEEAVCAREKAWRRYTELRDGKETGSSSERTIRKWSRNRLYL